MTASTLKVEGTITRIVKLETRKGASFIRVHLKSPKISIDVDIFDRDQQRLLDQAMPGDHLCASGSGFHRGSIRNGSTSLTARYLKHIRDDAGRTIRTRPEQLSLFAA